MEVARAGDIAYVTGAHQLSIKDPQGNVVEDRGKSMEVWTKQADAKWKAVASGLRSGNCR